MYTTGLSLTPAESWTLIAALALLAALGTLLIRELLIAVDVLPELIRNNFKIYGLKGVWYALRGEELAYVGLEKIIEVVPKDGAWTYNVLTSDGECNRKYTVIVTREDEENPDYQFAKQIAFDDKKFFHSLLPDSRIKKHLYTTDKETGELLQEFFVLYLKDNNTNEVEAVLNEYFEHEYRKRIRGTEAIA